MSGSRLHVTKCLFFFHYLCPIALFSFSHYRGHGHHCSVLLHVRAESDNELDLITELVYIKLAQSVAGSG